MKRFVFELTDELLEVINAASGKKTRNAAIEDWLWSIPAIRRTARKKGVNRGRRRGRGRPRGEVER